MPLRPDLIPEPILLAVPDEAGVLAWPAVFGNDHPVELEIGAGKGTFLLAIAEARPDTNFLGLEYAKAYAEYAADRLRRHHCLNCRIVHAEASWWIRCHVPAASIRALHIYFPDPWPKKRHHKRRLIQLPFLKEVHRILVPGGQLRLVTDHEDYFRHMQATLGAQSDLPPVPFASPVTGEILAPAGGGQVETNTGVVGTNFERKYLAAGRSFYAIAAAKPPVQLHPQAGS